MKTAHRTPAECLLQRLLRSEKLDTGYRVTVCKEEHYTCILLQQKLPDLPAVNASAERSLPQFIQPVYQ